MLFANSSKITRNWFLTLQHDNYLQFIKVGKKGHGCNMRLYNIFVYVPICALIYLCICVKERKTSLKFLHWFYIWSCKHRFWQIRNFDVKGTGSVYLELSIIFTQTAGRFDMWVTPYTGILTLAKLRYFISKDLSTKTL